MDYLADANILVRLSNSADPLHSDADHAVKTLKRQGNTLCISPQCIYEFWAVATRPNTSRGGLGMTPQQAETEIIAHRNFFTLLPDQPALFDEWHRLVNHYGVSGVNAHDARIVAAMLTHGITHLLTFNTSDFTRYTEISVVHPNNV